MINVMAASEMLRKPNRMMERLFQQDHVSKDSMTEIAEMKEQVLEPVSYTHLDVYKRQVGIYWRHMMPECKYDGTIPGYPCVKHGIAGLL